SVCLGQGERPATVADIGQAVRDRVVSFLPRAHPSFQPATGGLVNLPTVFAAGQSRRFRTKPFDLIAFSVVVRATASWDWHFEPAAPERFSKPSGGWPDTSVTHTSLTAGHRPVTVTTHWRCSYTVDGRGPYLVPGGDLSMDSPSITVPIREAHAELV